ncbi:MAG: hypothetical protein K5644_09175, partial [Lachnospiraceae bacterium]|nr:hypothetical protein [Lachnospiraceae bacterium]
KKEEGYNNDCKSEKVSGLIITVSSKEQLSAICNTDNLGDYDLIIPMDNYELFKCVANRKSDYSAKSIFAKLPVVIRDKSKDTLVDSIDILQIYDGVVVSGYDGLYFAKKHLNKPIIADSSLYSYNNYAIDTIAGLGVDINVAPLELNNKELSHRNNKNSVLTIYGRIPMMITNNCINKNCNYCDNTEKLLTIKDKKGHSFPVRNFCKMCYNVIYNESPTCLFNESDKINKLKFSGFKIDFTNESGELTKKILKLYADSFIYDKAINIDFGYTKGHFNRGVE